MGKLGNIGVQAPNLKKATTFYEGHFAGKRLRKVIAQIGKADICHHANRRILPPTLTLVTAHYLYLIMSITQIIALSRESQSNLLTNDLVRVRGFWVRALDWLIATQKRRAKSVLQNYYDGHQR
jgi:hypothetical protein